MPTVKVLEPECSIFLIDLILHIWLILHVLGLNVGLVVNVKADCADKLQIQMRTNLIIAERNGQSMRAF